MTWDAVHALDRASVVALLPVGAVEAHGPHMPLSTDVIIAEAMARACGQTLSDAGGSALLLPPVWYTAAGFARAFPGTVQVRPDTVTELVVDIAASLASQGFRMMAVANAHLDPAHLASLRAAVAGAPEGIRIVFLDLTRRAVAAQLSKEFQTGACHAGRFEGSVVLAEAPELFRREVADRLAPNPSSLSDAVRDGLATFADAGGPDAYFGWPAEATAAEGRATVATLGRLLGEAVDSAWLEGE